MRQVQIFQTESYAINDSKELIDKHNFEGLERKTNVKNHFLWILEDIGILDLIQNSSRPLESLMKRSKFIKGFFNTAGRAKERVEFYYEILQDRPKVH